jgi:hypothetical protein
MNSRNSGTGGYKNSNLNSVLSKQNGAPTQHNPKPYANGLVPLGAPKVRLFVVGSVGSHKIGLEKEDLVWFDHPVAGPRCHRGERDLFAHPFYVGLFVENTISIGGGRV